VLKKDPERRNFANRFDARATARKALLNILQPLAGFVLDTGLSVQEFQAIYRIAAVRSAAERQRELTGRISISGIAASTGIPRAEISRILKTTPRQQPSDRKQQATNLILSAWHQDPKFTSANGSPSDLPIFGVGSTFDALVKTHGRGIPTRAMLDELARTDSIEVISPGTVRAKSVVAVDNGAGPRAVKAFGDRAAEFLSTMLLNMRDPERFRFVSNVSSVIDAGNALPIVRKEISTRGQNFLAAIRETLFRDPVHKGSTTRRSVRKPVRVSVTIYYREAEQYKQPHGPLAKTRRNFRRGFSAT